MKLFWPEAASLAWLGIKDLDLLDRIHFMFWNRVLSLPSRELSSREFILYQFAWGDEMGTKYFQIIA